MREGLSRTGQDKLHVSTRVDPWIVDRLDDLWSPRGICSKAALLLEAVLEHSEAPSIEVLLDDILRTHRPVAPREGLDAATVATLRRLIRGAGEGHANGHANSRPSLRDLRRPPPRQRVSARISARAHARLTHLARHVGASRGAAMILGALATAFHAQAFDTVMLKLHTHQLAPASRGADGASVAG